MLQQTRVETVMPYYARFLRSYPTVHALAEAALDDVLARWSGLGYYRRARMLHAGAQHVSRALGGAFPDEVAGLRAIPGIGPYTAGAVASIAFGRRAALVDGNVTRVLARLFAIEDDLRGGSGIRLAWRLAEEIAHDREPGTWNQALMELGATVCLPREPRCPMCPVRGSCDARARGIQRDLPKLRPKAKPLPEARVALVGTIRGGVLLARRHADGRFGGMWEPPSALGHDPRVLPKIAGVRISHAEEVGHVKHVLSHRRLDVKVVRARLLREPSGDTAARGDYDRLAMVSSDDLGERALTTLARKILATAKLG